MYNFGHTDKVIRFWGLKGQVMTRLNMVKWQRHTRRCLPVIVVCCL